MEDLVAEPTERWRLARRHRLCFMCLRIGHMTLMDAGGSIVDFTALGGNGSWAKRKLPELPTFGGKP